MTICRGCGTEAAVAEDGLCALCVPFLVDGDVDTSRRIVLELADMDPDDGNDFRCKLCGADLYRDDEDSPAELRDHSYRCVWRLAKELVDPAAQVSQRTETT